MGWNTQKQITDGRNAVLALTQEQRESLTWEKARKMVLCDTLAGARWRGLEQRKEGTPFQALCRVWFISESEAKDE